MVPSRCRHPLYAGVLHHRSRPSQRRQPDGDYISDEFHRPQQFRRVCPHHANRNRRQTRPPTPSSTFPHLAFVDSCIYSLRFSPRARRRATLHLRLGRHQLFGDCSARSPRQLASARRRSESHRATVSASGSRFLRYSTPFRTAGGYGRRSSCGDSTEFARLDTLARFVSRHISPDSSHLLPQTTPRPTLQ